VHEETQEKFREKEMGCADAKCDLVIFAIHTEHIQIEITF